MNIRVLSAGALTPDHLSAWADIQRADASLDSPYFRPEFTQAVASVRGDVEVAVLEQGGQYVGFFPFQRGRKNVARPVGGMMSDFQGIVIRQGVSWDPRQLLRDCRLAAWHFDHLIAGQEPFQPYHRSVAPSPYVDLSQGWDGYQRQQQELHRSSFKGAMRKLRDAARKAGPLRFEPQTDDPAVFQAMVRWKTEQYRRTGVTNVLGFDWTIALLQRILATRGEAFGGMMSALYLGDALATVLFSMRSYDVVHGWFSAYCPDFATLSPGQILWIELAKAYPAIGIRRVELGKGPESYKRHLMSGATEVAEGVVDFRPVVNMMRRSWHRVYDWARQSPLRRPLLAPGRFLRTLIESRRFR